MSDVRFEIIRAKNGTMYIANQGADKPENHIILEQDLTLPEVERLLWPLAEMRDEHHVAPGSGDGRNPVIDDTD